MPILGEGWKFQPRNGSHTVAFEEPVCFPGCQKFGMQPPQFPSSLAPAAGHGSVPEDTFSITRGKVDLTSE